MADVSAKWRFALGEPGDDDRRRAGQLALALRGEVSAAWDDETHAINIMAAALFVCRLSATIEAEASARREAIEDIKRRLDFRLNEHLVEMREGFDDSIVGFNEAWDVMRELFERAIAAPETDSADSYPGTQTSSC